MAGTSTNLSLILPVATDATVVRTVYNTNWETIDDIFDDVTLTEFAYLDGVTSAIQTQLDAKQPLDTGLTSIAGLTTAANKMIYTTALDTYAVIDLTAFARSILDDADEATFKATVNLEIGTDVLADQTIGIANDNLVEIDDADAADNDYCKLTANGIEGRSYSEVKTDLSLNNVTNDAQIAKSLGTTQGDIIYFTGSATPVRLAKGTATQVLAMNAGATAPEWVAAGYANLTSFVDQTAWRVFYSNAAGDIVELALGADGTYLESNGAAAAPTFTVPSGAGDVCKVGTPVDSQVGVWTGDGTIEGHSSLTYDRSNLQLTGDIGSTGTRITKGWFADLQVTNAIAGSITGNAATFTCTDNENEALNCPIVFVDGATGAQGAETDGDLHYNPSTGLVTATAFAGSGASLTGANTGFTSILNAALYVGRDADNQIKFATDNNIIFRLAGVDGALFGSTGELDMNANSIGFTQQTVTYNVTTTTADWTNGNKATMTFGAGNIGTFAFTNPTNPCNLVLKVIQDATGSRVVTAWDADIKWAGGSAPTLTTTANGIDVVSFYWDGTNYFGVASLAFS